MRFQIATRCPGGMRLRYSATARWRSSAFGNGHHSGISIPMIFKPSCPFAGSAWFALLHQANASRSTDQASQCGQSSHISRRCSSRMNKRCSLILVSHFHGLAFMFSTSFQNARYSLSSLLCRRLHLTMSHQAHGQKRVCHGSIHPFGSRSPKTGRQQFVIVGVSGSRYSTR
jgi:hypothetical protein